MAFTHLHFHTSYSFLDGYNPIKKAVARIKELGMTACAITDHNTLGGIPEFQEECMKQGIKPLLGVEGYYTPSIEEASKPREVRNKEAIRRAIQGGVIKDIETLNQPNLDAAHHFNGMRISPYLTEWEPYQEGTESVKKWIQRAFGYDMRQFHILYIAKNQTGWRNLVKLQSEAARVCTYNGRYLSDPDLIERYHEGIICTAACIGSYPAQMVLLGRKDLAEGYIKKMREIFGDDFYLEIQPLNIEKQRKVNLFYLEMAQKHGVKVVATNDVHYTLKEDNDDHDTLLCIGMGKKKSDPDRMHYSHDFWIKSESEMEESFEIQEASLEETHEDYPSFWKIALANTQEVADKCSGDIQLGSSRPLFSNVKVPKRFTPEQYLTKIAFEGLYKYLSKHPECDRITYEKRLFMELNIINPKGFAPYMLAVREYVSWANENNCPTGPGRGSAAGSLCLFSIGVTKNIDPIKYQLLFSRFLTADRKDPPDWKKVA